MAEADRATNIEQSVNYSSPLDKQVRTFPEGKKKTLSNLLSLTDDLSTRDFFDASTFRLNLTQGVTREEVHFDYRKKSLLLNSRPATVLQVMTKMEEVNFNYEPEVIQNYSDEELYEKTKSNYQSTIDALIEASTSEFLRDCESPRFKVEANQAEALAKEIKLNLDDTRIPEMRRSFKAYVTGRADTMFRELHTAQEPKKIVELVNHITHVMVSENEAISRPIVKRNLPEIFKVLMRKANLFKDHFNSYQTIKDSLEAMIIFTAYQRAPILLRELEEVEKKSQEAEEAEKSKVAKISFWESLRLRLAADWYGQD